MTEAAMTAEEGMTVEAETKEETEIEIAQIIEAGTVETTVTGNVRSAITRTSHSEPNAIAVANLKEEAAGTIEEVETEMTVEAVVEVTAETETSGAPTEELIQITTGLVANVKTQTSHSELNATAVEHLKEEAEALANNGRVMSAGPVIEEMHHNLEREIGNALSVENPISLNEMIALAVGAQRGLAAPSKEGIIAN